MTTTTRTLRGRILDAAARPLSSCWQALRSAQRSLLDGLRRVRGGRIGGFAAALRRFSNTFLAAVGAFDRDARAVIEQWVITTLPLLYRDGALDALDRAPFSVRHRAAPFSWSPTHTHTVTTLSAQYYADLINRITETVLRAQAFLRAAQDQARRPEGVDRDQLLGEHPLDTVIYRNQARYPAHSWATAALGAQATTTTNTASLTYGQSELGADWFECTDGPGCGFLTHNDPDRADRTIRSAADALAHPLAHFGCVREWTPRPDLNTRPNLVSGAPV
ncbi:hypothetical protein ACIPW9_36135 [Streptomyces sp. NPDC090052]|uniref:hypothetical protein n=1 Tax=Streptomyces sp. NPDC090052 TaxID=3365931 RepID=UPI00381030C6